VILRAQDEDRTNFHHHCQSEVDSPL